MFQTIWWELDYVVKLELGELKSIMLQKKNKLNSSQMSSKVLCYSQKDFLV